jgi:GT2 family glycosyltransferase
MIRRQALEVLKGFDEHFGILEDQDIAIRMAQTGLKIAFQADPPVTRYRCHDKNYSSHGWLFLKADWRILRDNWNLYEATFGPGAWRVQMAKAIERYGRKTRFMGLPTRLMGRLFRASAPWCRIPEVADLHPSTPVK